MKIISDDDFVLINTTLNYIRLMMRHSHIFVLKFAPSELSLLPIHRTHRILCEISLFVCCFCFVLFFCCECKIL